MIVVISGTNRPGNNSARVAATLIERVAEAGESVFPILLDELPRTLFTPEAYEEKPEAFAPIQEAVLQADGLITVVPEYNGSFPGALKYFIDCLQFPESLVGKPAAFVGIAAGQWGGLRAVEQLEMIFQYRHAHLYGRRVFLCGINKLMTDGRITDADSLRRLDELVKGFVPFCRALCADESGAR